MNCHRTQAAGYVDGRIYNQIEINIVYTIFIKAIFFTVCLHH